MLDLYGHRVSSRPQTSQKSISWVRMRVERRYDERFSDRRQNTATVVLVRRRTYLAAFLLILYQYAMVDTISLLPIGIICWSVSLSVALEVLAEHKKQVQLEVRALWQQRDDLQQRYQTALFEYRVMKRSKKSIVAIEENGKVLLVAM